ncbi:MAG: zinc ribbon domain-containing protein [Anaerolineales bacterium]|nr:zinc ribbon domain-containing protein [Anaerolineales bacterium]
MPIYTYRCSNCGVQFDQQQKFSDPPLTRCPECSKKTLHKVYQPVGIVFKGSGFYATDHRSPSGASRASKEKEEKSESKSGSEAKSEAESSTSSSSKKDKD